MAIFRSFVQGVMVRLMLVLAPVMCILSGIAVSTALAGQIKYLDAPRHGSGHSSVDKKPKKGEVVVPFRSEVAWTFTALMTLFLVQYFMLFLMNLTSIFRYTNNY